MTIEAWNSWLRIILMKEQMIDTPRVEEIIKRYNHLLANHNYWIDGGMSLVEYLHSKGMRYKEIYDIMEGSNNERPSD